MSDWKRRMQKCVDHLAGQIAAIRPGSLSPGFIETFRVAVRGDSAPISRIAAVASERGRFLVTPFDPSDVPAVVKALTDGRLNAYAINPRSVCVVVPPMSGEQKAEMARHVKSLGEQARVAVRAVRQDARQEIAARGRGSQRAVQEATDASVEQIDRLVKAKTAELEK